MRSFFGSVILVLFVNSTASGEENIDSLPTEELITKLTEESNQGIGSHTSASVTGFLAIDDEPRFRKIGSGCKS